MTFSDESRQKLKSVSAATLTSVRLKHGLRNVFIRNVHKISKDAPRLVGPAYHSAPSAPTNLIRHHALDLNQPIGCGDVPVYPGDIMVGDDEGLVVIPAAMAEEVADEAFEQTVFENFVEERVRAGKGIFGLCPPEAELAFRERRREKGR
ncbi:Dimethylmenaquinone methyltransferase [Neorhizobium galegae bv. officinalis]|nr:Dimethylmenaquinone methyltransferase [Neorhizobium galegae bv. officinalis]